MQEHQHGQPNPNTPWDAPQLIGKCDMEGHWLILKKARNAIRRFSHLIDGIAAIRATNAVAYDGSELASCFFRDVRAFGWMDLPQTKRKGSSTG